MSSGAGFAWAGQIPQPQAFEAVTGPAGHGRSGGTTGGADHPGRPGRSIASPRQARADLQPSVSATRKPINFGSASPRKLAVHGVDVSRWQGEIDWAKLRTQGANFAYIKATDGGDHLDPMFRKNWRAAKDAGLKRGAYHFFYWCRTAGEQADWFIRNVPRDADALPPVIDVEYNGELSCKKRLSRAHVLEKMQVFMDKLERHYGKRPIIYTAPDFYRDNLKGEFPIIRSGCARWPHTLKGLSGPQMAVLAVFRLRPFAWRRGQDRPQRVPWQRRRLAQLGGAELTGRRAFV